MAFVHSKGIHLSDWMKAPERKHVSCVHQKGCIEKVRRLLEVTTYEMRDN